MPRTATPGDAERSGVNPTSRMKVPATTVMTTSRPTRTRKGAPSDVACARRPPPTAPSSIATPPTTWARANTASSGSSWPVAASASTSHASTAPEKNVKPSPMSTDTTAHCQNGPWDTQRR